MGSSRSGSAWRSAPPQNVSVLGGTKGSTCIRCKYLWSSDNIRVCIATPPSTSYRLWIKRLRWHVAAQLNRSGSWPDHPALAGLAHIPLMFSVARGLPFNLRASLRPPGWLLTSRPPLVLKSPSTLNAFRQFSSTRFQNAEYSRFGVDPEQPFNSRRWSTGTQVFGGIVVLSVAYYAAQYVPAFTRVHHWPTTFLRVCSLETVPETGRWRFMDVSPKFETRVMSELRVEYEICN